MINFFFTYARNLQRSELSPLLHCHAIRIRHHSSYTILSGWGWNGTFSAYLHLQRSALYECTPSFSHIRAVFSRYTNVGSQTFEIRMHVNKPTYVEKEHAKFYHFIKPSSIQATFRKISSINRYLEKLAFFDILINTSLCISLDTTKIRIIFSRQFRNDLLRKGSRFWGRS